MGSYREDYGADALSLMEQLSQHTAAAFMEAEQILSSCDGNAKESLQSLPDKPVANGKENNMLAMDRQRGWMGLCIQMLSSIISGSCSEDINCTLMMGMFKQLHR